MRALVLAGGFPQIALIAELHNRSIYVILADYNENPVAKKFADKYYQVSTLDVEAIKKVAVDENVDIIITVCTDQALLTVAKVSEDLGLPCYIDYQTALNVTNKRYMKDMFEKYSIPSSKYVISDKLSEALIKNLNYPMIVKPVDCNSSKGVRKCNNREELEIFFRDATKYSRTSTAIIENFIEGDEITVDVYVENGKANVLSVSNSVKVKEKDKFIIFRTINPAPVSDDVYVKIKIVAQQIADAFKLADSPMLIQMICNGNDIFVIEFSARTGGGAKYLLVKHACGFDVIKAVVDLTLGERPCYEGTKPAERFLVNDFVYCKAGTFDHLEGFKEMKEKGVIHDYYIFAWDGIEYSGCLRASGDRVCGYTIVGETAEDVIQKHNIAREHIKVIDRNEEDIARHDILTNLYTRDGYLYSE